MKYLLRIAPLLIFAIAAFAPGAHAANAPSPAANVIGSISLMAAPGDTIFAAHKHHHEYIYVAHARDHSVEVIDVSNPAEPRQLTGKDADRARPMGHGARVPESVLAEFPDAISATTDHRKLIYVLDQESLRVLAAPQQQNEESDDGWFRNSQTPG